MEYRTLQGHRSNSTFYIVGSHCYLKNRQRDTLMYLRCHHYPQCAGSAKLSQTTQLVENIQVHTCGTTTEDYDYLTSLQRMRELSATTQRPPILIYQEVMRDATPEVRSELTFPKVTQMLHYVRIKNFLQNPDSPSSAIDALEAETNPFPDFYQGHVTFQDQVALLFASPNLLHCLQNMKEIFVDATFRVVPRNFRGGQLFTILADYQGTVIPILHVLMTGKKEGLYKAVFMKISMLVPQFSPEVAMADFETAIKNGLKAVFPNVNVKGCRFHFGQALLKKLKAVGLMPAYLKDPAFRKWAKKYIALCCLPPDNIPEEFEKLRRQTQLWSPNR